MFAIYRVRSISELERGPISDSFKNVLPLMSLNKTLEVVQNNRSFHEMRRGEVD